MSKSNRQQIAEFNFTGELRKFIKKQNKIKYLLLVNSDRQYWIKVAKDKRDNLKLETGCQLTVTGIKKQKLKTGKVKFIAQIIQHKQEFTRDRAEAFNNEANFQIKPKAKVLICQKSNCWQRGGKEVCQKLAQIFRDDDLDKTIEIKMTGCLGKCGQAPNIVMLPDKTRHSNIKPKQIPALVEKHLIAN